MLLRMVIWMCCSGLGLRQSLVLNRTHLIHLIFLINYLINYLMNYLMNCLMNMYELIG